MKKRIISGAMSLFLLSLFPLGASATYAATQETLPTEIFINKNMTNPNGTLATYLQPSNAVDPDLAAGRESLSESYGLLLEYLYQKQDKEQFKHTYQLFISNFYDTNIGFIYWKIGPHGEKITSTDALIDNLRIFEALYKAAKKWGNHDYLTTALKIGAFISSKDRNSNSFVDFYDKKYNTASKSLTISYLPINALQILKNEKLLSSDAYNQTALFLQKLPTKNGFFPKSYNVSTKTYKYDQTINMIDQVYTAYNRAEGGYQNPALYAFLKSEFTKRGKILGQYSLGKQPAVNYESMSLYSLVILYALQVKDIAFANQISNRMLQFRDNNANSMYYGGYYYPEKNGINTHIFDNLLPLLSQYELEHAAAVY